MAASDLTNRKSFEELAKLTKPTYANLKKLFESIDKVVIKRGGVSDNKALTNDVVLVISEADKIEKLNDLLAINELNTGFYCLCLGSYAIELYCNDILQTTIGFHHGVSIRYNKWNGDAELLKSDLLLKFLDEEGLGEPLQDRLRAKERQSEDYIVKEKWLDRAPRCFRKYWVEMNDFEDGFIPLLIKDLDEELPNTDVQIIRLLQTLGCSKNLWTGYPMYEELPNKILKKFKLPEIINTYLNSDRNYKTRIGLGRFLCSFEFKKTRRKHLQYIPVSVISDLEKCFKSINETHGINEIAKLAKEKVVAK